MDELVIHDQTRSQLEHYLRQPAHALLLIGPDGSGKQAIVEALAKQLLTSRNEVHFKTVEPEKDKQSIGIETIRELQQFVKLKLSSDVDQRIIHINGAHLLTGEAQNAFLKMLEEPSTGTLYILTATNEQALLPTIRSRVQHLAIHRPDRQAIERFFVEQGFDAKDIAQAYSLSGGWPGLMGALLHDATHPLRQTAQAARQLLQMTQFERLCQVDAMSKNKADTVQLLRILQLMARTALEQTADKALAAAAPADRPLRQWHKVLQASYDAEQAYAVSAQAKLALTNLMLVL